MRIRVLILLHNNNELNQTKVYILSLLPSLALFTLILHCTFK